MSANISDAERNDFIMARLDEGLSLSDVQDQLAEHLGIQMTYMELRLLTSELQVNWTKQDQKAQAARPKDPNAPAAAPAQAPADAAEAGDYDDAPAYADAEGEGGAEEDAAPEEEDEYIAAQRKAMEAIEKLAAKTQVEVSSVVRPGASLSGTVTFASGAHGDWFVDQQGRMGFEPADGSANPNQSDLQGFQVALRRKLGY